MASNLNSSSKQIHIVAIQSIIPGKITEPRQSRRINTPAPLRNEALQSHLRIVLYYNVNANAGEDESGVAMAGWIKETLSTALSEHPVLAGRLRKDREGDGYWEIKFNDAGVRMMQATAEVSMAEFLKAEEEEEEEEEREARERLLAYWMDVDREHPELSALFYIQVTEFQGDGYSIGISCSLLLADPLFLTKFLKKWAVAHSSMLAQAHPKIPIFHLGYFTTAQRPTHLKSTPLDSAQRKPITKTILFKFPLVSSDSKLTPTAMASLCIREATRRLKSIMPVSEFSAIVSNRMNERTVESCKKEELVRSDVFVGAISATSLEELGLDEMALSEGNRPVRVSCGVMSGEHEGLAVVMLPAHEDGDSEVVISVTVPLKK